MKTSPRERCICKTVNTYTIVFILSGEALVSCSESVDVPFSAGQILLWPVNSTYVWKSLSSVSAIVLEGDNDLSLCDHEALKNYGEYWLNATPDFQGLSIKPRLHDFLLSVRNYLSYKEFCPYMHQIKQQELSVIFRAYYSPQELINFFIPMIKNNLEFESFVMNNYLKMKGVREFVALSGMSVNAFNRKFKLHFNETPYQWLIKQKSKHIYHALCTTDKSFTAIAKDFYFVDTSHFDRYCKRMFGALPSEIRYKKVNQVVEL